MGGPNQVKRNEQNRIVPSHAQEATEAPTYYWEDVRALRAKDAFRVPLKKQK